MSTVDPIVQGLSAIRRGLLDRERALVAEQAGVQFELAKIEGASLPWTGRPDRVPARPAEKPATDPALQPQLKGPGKCGCGRARAHLSGPKFPVGSLRGCVA